MKAENKITAAIPNSSLLFSKSKYRILYKIIPNNILKIIVIENANTPHFILSVTNKVPMAGETATIATKKHIKAITTELKYKNTFFSFNFCPLLQQNF